MSELDNILNDPEGALEDSYQTFYPYSPDNLTQAYEWLTGQEDPNTVDNGFKANVRSNVAPIPVVYGRARLGGIVVLPWTQTGANGEYIHSVFVLCEGSIQSVDNIFIDETNITDSRFTGLVRANIHLGDDAQAADADAVAEITEWTTNHRLRGVAYVYLRLKYSRDAFSGVPGNVQFEVTGRDTIYDPRDASTGYSNNPELCTRDYLINARYGKGLAAADLDDESSKTAANVCDEQITPYTGAGSTINRFECDGIVDTGNRIFENLKSLLANFRAGLPQINGKYTCVVDAATTPEADGLSEADIIGGVRVKTRKASKQYNRVTVRYMHPENNWQPDLAVVNSSTLRAQDNDVLIETEARMPFCINPYRAERMGETVMKDSRERIEVSFLASLKPWRKQLFDVLPLDWAALGWSGKNFRISRLALQANGFVMGLYREYEATVFDENIPVEWITPADTQLPNPFFCEPPTVLQLVSGTAALYLKNDGTVVSRIWVAWVASADAFVDFYQVQYKRNADSEWITAGRVDAFDAMELYIADVKDGVAYDVRVHAFNANDVPSAAITIADHMVIGKTAPPPDPSGFRVSQNGNVLVLKWGAPNYSDHSGADIRYAISGNSNYDDATPLTEITKGTNLTTGDMPDGDWLFFVKFVDTSGNYSLNAATASVNFASDYTAIVLRHEEPDWLGTLTNFVTSVSNKLVVESTLAANAHTDTELFEQHVTYPESQCIYEAPETVLAFVDDVRVSGAIDSVLGPGKTGVADPQLQIDYSETGSYDGFEDWGVGFVKAVRVKYRLVLDTSEGVAVIQGFDPTIDKQETTQREFGRSVGAGGGTVTFATRFHNVPFVNVAVLGTAGRNHTEDNITAIDFDEHIFDGATEVGGTYNYEAKGV